MKDLFYKENVKLCREFKNSKIFPCVTPIPEWLEKAVEKSPEFNLINMEVAYGKENS